MTIYFISGLHAVRRALFGAQAEVTQQPKVETYASSLSSLGKTKVYEIIGHVNPYIALRQIHPIFK